MGKRYDSLQKKVSKWCYTTKRVLISSDIRKGGKPQGHTTTTQPNRMAKQKTNTVSAITKSWQECGAVEIGTIFKKIKINIYKKGDIKK